MGKVLVQVFGVEDFNQIPGCGTGQNGIEEKANPADFNDLEEGDGGGCLEQQQQFPAVAGDAGDGN